MHFHTVQVLLMYFGILYKILSVYCVQSFENSTDFPVIFIELIQLQQQLIGNLLLLVHRNFHSQVKGRRNSQYLKKLLYAPQELDFMGFQQSTPGQWEDTQPCQIRLSKTRFTNMKSKYFVIQGKVLWSDHILKFVGSNPQLC